MILCQFSRAIPNRWKKLYIFCQHVSGYLVIFSPDNRLPSAVMFSCPECSLSCILDCTHTSCWSDNRSLTAGHSRHQTPGIRAMVTTFIVTWAVTNKTWGLMKIKGSQTKAKPLSQRLLLIIPSEWDYSESVSLIQQASWLPWPLTWWTLFTLLSTLQWRVLTFRTWTIWSSQCVNIDWTSDICNQKDTVLLFVTGCLLTND